MNYNKANQLLINGLFLVYLLYLMITGNIRHYLHPKMDIYIYLSILVLGVLFVSQFPQLFKETDKSVLPKAGIILFLLPVSFSLLSDYSTIQGDLMETRGVQIGQQARFYPDSNRIPTSNSPQAIIGSPERQQEDRTYGLEESLIKVRAENFMSQLDAIFSHPQEFLGSEIDIEGFVFFSPGFEGDQFVLSRMLVNCCAADATLVGIFCSVPGQMDSPLVDRGWYKIRGVLDLVSFSGQQYPMINTWSYLEIPEPEFPFIF